MKAQCPLCGKKEKLQDHFLACMKERQTQDFALIDKKCVGLTVDGDKFYYSSPCNDRYFSATDSSHFSIYPDEVVYGSWKHSENIGPVTEVDGDFTFTKQPFYFRWRDSPAEPEEEEFRLKGNPNLDKKFAAEVTGESAYNGPSFQNFRGIDQAVKYVSVLIDGAWFVADVVFDSIVSSPQSKKYIGYFYVHPYGAPPSSAALIKIPAGSKDLKFHICEEAYDAYIQWRDSWSRKSLSCLDMVDVVLTPLSLFPDPTSENEPHRKERLRFLQAKYGNDRVVARLFGGDMQTCVFLSKDGKKPVLASHDDCHLPLSKLSREMDGSEEQLFVKCHNDFDGYVIQTNDFAVQILVTPDYGERNWGTLIWVLKDEIRTVTSSQSAWRLKHAMTFQPNMHRGMIVTRITSTHVQFLKVTEVLRRKCAYDVWELGRWVPSHRTFQNPYLSHCNYPPSLSKKNLKFESSEYYKLLAKVLVFRARLEAGLDVMAFLDKNSQIIPLIPFFQARKEERPLIYDLLDYGSVELAQRVLLGGNFQKEDYDAMFKLPSDPTSGWPLEISMACFDFDFFLQFIKSQPRLCKDPAYLKIRDNDGNTILHYAVAWNDVKLFRFAAPKRGLIESVNTEGKSPLTVAIDSGNVNMARQLVQLKKTMLTQTSRKPLNSRCRNADPPIVAAFQGLQNSKMIDLVLPYACKLNPGYIDSEGISWRERFQFHTKHDWLA